MPRIPSREPSRPFLGPEQGMVFSIAYHFLRDRSAAEEVAQDVFLQLHRRFRRIRK